jgi:hypothetical protein
MTTHKGFKRLVRERMATTGERYAAARRALLADTDGSPTPTATAVAARAGRRRLHPNSSAIATVLEARGVASPLTGEPLSEAVIHGVGGGVGAGYILWQFKTRDTAILTLGFTNQWQYPGIPGWFGTTLERLGVPAELHETSGAKGARETLDGIIATGEPVIAFIDQQSSGTWGLPEELSGYSGYPVVVTGRTSDGSYLVDDRGDEPLVFDERTMAAARARIPSWKHRLIRLRPDAPLTADRLRRAIEAGLADQVEHLSSSSDSFGLPAWRKWSRMMTDTKHAKGWPRVFAGGTGLFGALLSIVEGVDGNIAAGGGHLRELQAAFLEEAVAILDRPALESAAAAWRGAADLWEDLADAAVPPDLDGAVDAVEADEALHDAVMEGEPGRARARDAAAQVWAARVRYARAFPLPEERVWELFTDLGRRIAAIHDAEVEAVEVTRRAVR